MCDEESISRDETTINAQDISANTSYKNATIFFRTVELVLGVVCVYLTDIWWWGYPSCQFLYLIMTTFTISTFILLLTYCVSSHTAAIMSKTIYEVVYNSMAFVLILTASTLVLTSALFYDDYYRTKHLFASSVCGIVIAVLYCANLYLSVRARREP